MIYIYIHIKIYNYIYIYILLYIYLRTNENNCKYHTQHLKKAFCLIGFDSIIGTSTAEPHKTSNPQLQAKNIHPLLCFWVPRTLRMAASTKLIAACWSWAASTAAMTQKIRVPKGQKGLENDKLGICCAFWGSKMSFKPHPHIYVPLLTSQILQVYGDIVTPSWPCLFQNPCPNLSTPGAPSGR